MKEKNQTSIEITKGMTQRGLEKMEDKGMLEKSLMNILRYLLL